MSRVQPSRVQSSEVRASKKSSARSSSATRGGAAAYAAAPETTKVIIAERYGHYIGGRWTSPRGDSTRRGASKESKATSRYFASINPATESVLCEVAHGSAADVDAAVTAAREALPAWAGLAPRERAKFIYRIARRIQERSRELAVLETMDGGKPIRESRDVDIPLAAAHFFYHAGWADKLSYAIPGGGGRSAKRSSGRAGRLPEVAPGLRPVGVCGQIIPWNFPLLMAAWKLAPALACGNTCVLKPAETTPLTALRLAEICDEVGLPPGVVNIVTGDGATGAAIVDHPGIDKIAFTGSTEVGRRIAAAVAREHGRDARSTDSHGRDARATDSLRRDVGGKRLTLELGGKSPNIIFEDASIDQAIEGIIEGIYFNQGHVCCAGSRLFVQESVLDEVSEKLRRRMASLRIGDPLDKNTDIGAINSRQQLATIQRYLEAGVDEGATLCIPTAVQRNGRPTASRRNGHAGAHEHVGSAAAMAGFDRGYWCRPCFFTDVQPSHTIAREEIFGPVLAVMSFRTPEEAISRANNTPYGLAAGVWTDKGSKIFDVARRLKAGVVWLNTYNKFDPASPFGGFKESGFGREGGRHGLGAYVDR